MKLEFENEGKYLASVSKDDSTVRIWKVVSSGFFGGILGMQGKHYKMYPLDGKLLCSKVEIKWNEKDNLLITSG